MTSKIFINLPVKDLARSMGFFKKLGYGFDPRFTDENAACMIVSDDIFVMLVVEKFFRTFTAKSIADTGYASEVLVGLSLPSRADVDRVVRAALLAGARPTGAARDRGFMYERGFEDLDGHVWQYLWMDPARLQSGAQGAATAA